jgi:hypothetical protein
MKIISKSILTAVVIEILSFSFLVIGKWELLGRVDAIGMIGLILHLPGFLIGKFFPGNISWVFIVGIPLFLWWLAAFAYFKSVRR